MSAGRVIFHMPDWLHHILSAGRILLKRTLEAYVEHYFHFKLEQIMQENRLVSLITLLRGNSFIRNIPQYCTSYKYIMCIHLHASNGLLGLLNAEPLQMQFSVRAQRHVLLKTNRNEPSRPLKR